MPKFLVVDDHPLFREALSSSIRQAFKGAAVLESGTLERGVELIGDHGDLDIVLLDLNLPGTSGFGGLLTLRTKFPKLPIVVVSGSDDRRIVAEALGYGAVGFIPKSVPTATLKSAIQEVIAGGVYLPAEFQGIGNDGQEPESDENDLAKQLTSLSPQQFRVLKMLGEGMLNKQIAFELDVGETTIKAHVSAILRKLKVHSRTQAVIKARGIEFESIMRQGDG